MSVEGGINKCFVYLPSKVTSYMDNILLAPLRLRIIPPLSPTKKILSIHVMSE